MEGVGVSLNTTEKGKSRRKGRRRRKRKSKKMEAEGSSEISSPTRLKIDESKTENEKCNEDNNQLTKDSQENNVRSWFNNLSGEDKALELSISDRKLIGMFLEMGCSGEFFHFVVNCAVLSVNRLLCYFSYAQKQRKNRILVVGAWAQTPISQHSQAPSTDHRLDK